MKRKFIFLSISLFLILHVVPTFSQASDDVDRFQKPSIQVIADEDLAEPAAVPQTKDTLNKNKGKVNNKPIKTPEEPKSTTTTDTPVLEVNAANNTNEQVIESPTNQKNSSPTNGKKNPSDKSDKSTPVPEEKTPEQPAEIIPQDTQPVDAAPVPETKATGKPNNNNNNNNNKGNKKPPQKPADDIAILPEIIADEPVVNSAPTDTAPPSDQIDEPAAPVDNEPVIEPEPEPEPEAVIDDQYYQDSYDDQYDIPQVNYDIPLDQFDHIYEPVYQAVPEASEPEPVVETQPEPVQPKQEIPAHNNNNKGSTHRAPEEVAPKPEIVKETKQNPVPEVQQNQQQQPGQKDVGHRNIEVQRQNTDAAKQRQEKFEREQREMQEQFNDDYFKLIGDHSKDYINQYRVYSDHFFNYVEGLFDEAVVPLYRQVRQHEYLSMALSSLIGFYILITFTKLFLSLFRKKPKFRYNKEETISQSDINANFKKFLGELEALKKQIATGPKGGAGATEGSAGTVAIPATLQQDLGTIINSLAKNDDAINRVIRDKSKSDTFLMDFQKEVVESHKAIWNELYQLRKIFSSGKVNTLSSASKARTETADDVKSLSSNPEITEPRATRATPKTTGEPRSKSVTPADPVRSRPAAPKEKKPVEVDHFTPSVNGHAQQEENKPQSATNVDRIPFGRPASKDEEPLPAVQIPTNLNENDPTHNPFATGHPTHPTPTNNTVNAKPGTPFGNPALRGKPNIVKPSGMPVPSQTSQENSANLLAKPELSVSRKSSMDVKGNVPAPVLNMPTTLQPTFEQPIEKGEEKIAANPEQEGTADETQTTEEGESENRGGFIPPMKPGGPGGLNPAFPRGKPMMPGNKAVPQVRRSGPPGTTVFKGPPGNLPRPGIPTQIKPSGPIPEGVPKTNNSQV